MRGFFREVTPEEGDDAKGGEEVEGVVVGEG